MLIITQQAKPRAIGFAPVLISFTISVLIPIALIAITIKNLLTLLRKEKSAAAVSRAAPVSV